MFYELRVSTSEGRNPCLIVSTTPGGVNFTAQLIGTAMGVVWALLGGTVVYGVLKATVGLKLSAEISAIIALVVNMGAYTTEIMRAGIQSIQKTQLEAADCLGLTRLQAIVHVVLLPAMERVYPALTSQFVLLMLASSITSQISTEELTAVANNVQSDTYRSFEVYILVALVYLALSAIYRLAFWVIGLGLFTRKRKLGTAL